MHLEQVLLLLLKPMIMGLTLWETLKYLKFLFRWTKCSLSSKNSLTILSI